MKSYTSFNKTLWTIFTLTFSVILFEISLTRIFAVTLFANYAQLVLALGIFGFSFGAIITYYLDVSSKVTNVDKFNRNALLIQSIVYFLVLLVVLKIRIFNDAPDHSFGYENRMDDFIHGWRNLNFYLLFLAITIAFTTAGTFICTIFALYKDKVNTLYGYDLIGAGLGALVFVPLAIYLPVPWVAALCSFICILLSLLLFFNYFSLVTAIVLAMLLVSSPSLLNVRFAAGLPESTVNFEQWTPTSRITIHKDSRGKDREIMVFDSASVSMVVKSEDHRNQLTNEVSRGIVYKLVPQGGKVAVLAASAGPEVAVAQASGFNDITAIDINGKGFDIIANRYGDSQVNPYRPLSVKKLNADGRAGVLSSKDKFDVIHMVHANLWSVAGLLANAWSPWLLTTTEAFQEYLSKLTDNGVMSFSKGFETNIFVPSVIDALQKFGVKNPFDHIVFMRSGSFVLLVRKTPWTDEQLNQLDDLVKNHYKRKVDWLIHPKIPQSHYNWDRNWFEIVTDNKPYPERNGKFYDIVKRMWAIYVLKDHSKLIADATSFIYLTNALQTLFSVLIGLLFIVPFVAILKIKNIGIGKFSTSIYFSCLGMGFILVQVALIHKLILLVGHPTYTLCLVLGTMLAFAGLGSLFSDKYNLSKINLKTFLLFSICTLGSIYLSTSVFPHVVRDLIISMNFLLKNLSAIAIVGLCSFFMGIFFPIGFNKVSQTDPKLGMIAWAFNGWFSVIGAVVSINLSREYGFNSTVWVALVSYFIALLVLNHWRGLRSS